MHVGSLACSLGRPLVGVQSGAILLPIAVLVWLALSALLPFSSLDYDGMRGLLLSNEGVKAQGQQCVHIRVRFAETAGSRWQSLGFRFPVEGTTIILDEGRRNCFLMLPQNVFRLSSLDKSGILL